MNKMILVLDTNVFDSMNYNFNNGSLKYLEEYISQGKIELWIHSVTVRETKSHIKNKLSDYVHYIKENRAFKNLLRTDKKYSDIFERVEKDDVIEDGIRVFEEYLARTNARILNASSVNIDDILNDYFEQIPPFSSSKKSEFPDAIMISSIRSELSSVDELHIVASDDDWRKSFEKERKVTIYKTIKEFLNYYNKQNHIRDAVSRYFDDADAAEQLSVYVKDILDSYSFDVEGQFADDDCLVYNQCCEEIASQFTKHFECDSLYVEYIESALSQNDLEDEIEGVVKVQMDSSAIIELECGYFDPENSTWDSEDKEYIHRAIDYVNESHRIEFTTIVTLKVKVKKGEETRFYIDGIQLEDVPQRLTFQTLLYIGDEIDDAFKVEKKYKCPICGKAIRLDLVKEACSTSSNERQMGEEIEYSIEYENVCENCLNGYKITGSIFEYPLKTLNLDDTTIEWEENIAK